MNELQQLFLFYVFIYYLIKGGIYIALYIGTVVAEKIALQRQEAIRQYYQKKRADERQKWKVAYSLFDDAQALPVHQPLALAQLVNNPKSFTAYSFVSSDGQRPMIQTPREQLR